MTATRPSQTLTILKNALLALLLILLVAQQPLSVSAFPGGVGGCAGGRAAVEGPHLTSSARITGPIGNARLQMVLDDQIVMRARDMVNFTIGVDHTLTLRRIDEDGIRFRGFLFRLGPGSVASVDTTDALDRTTDDTIIAFEHCVSGQGVGGLSHTNSNLKEQVSGVLRMDVVADKMPLDVTVVIQNRNGLSEFYYQRFIVNAVTTATGPGGPAAPTLPPLPPSVVDGVPPNLAPVLPPVQAPTTNAPVVAPVAPPVAAPVVSGGAPVVTDRKVPDEAKCGSLAGAAGRGGSAAQSKDCSRNGSNDGARRRKLKGSSY